MAQTGAGPGLFEHEFVSAAWPSLGLVVRIRASQAGCSGFELR